MKIKKILVSQPQPQDTSSAYYTIAEKYKVKLDFRPFIKVEPIFAKEFRTQKVNLADATAIIFNSRTGIDHFFRLCEEMRYKVPDTLKYFCTSEAIGHYLQKYIQYRKRKVFFGDGRWESLIAIINQHRDEAYLVVLPDNDNAAPLAQLRKSGLKYQVGLMYRTVSNDFGPDEEFNYDMLIFFSPQGINALIKNFPDFKQGEVCIGCLGKSTAAVAREAGLRLDLEVPNAKFTSMAAALDDFVKENHKARR